MLKSELTGREHTHTLTHSDTLSHTHRSNFINSVSCGSVPRPLVLFQKFTRCLQRRVVILADSEQRRGKQHPVVVVVV